MMDALPASIPAHCRLVPLFDSQSPDGLLIAAALAGEDEAFAIVARRYQGPLFKAAVSRLGRWELAEEAVQETFLCAHRWLATYDSRLSFRTWLWTILLNQCSRQGKREARQVEPAVFCFAERNHTENAPLEQLLARESCERVHELLGRLPEVQADALRLRFFGGMTFPEIAAAMKCSEAGAKHRVKSGLLKLAEWLRSGNANGAMRNRPLAERVDHFGDSL
jgi:RNA polymerase sigma-70 factor, ECF subfamily